MSRATFLSRIGLGLGLSCSLLGCEYNVDNEHRLTSLHIGLLGPQENELGSPTHKVSPQVMRFAVRALDEQGMVMPVDRTVQAFLVAGGSRLPLQNPCALVGNTSSTPNWLLAQFSLVAGQAPVVTLPMNTPAIFGRVTLNLEEPESLAAGATPPIYFPNPTISQIMRPLDPSAQNASYCQPYLNRQVVFDRTTDEAGSLVVSSVFQSGLAVSDTSASDYNSIYVFTFGRPPASIVKGRVLSRLSGAIAKFNGMTQVANPSLVPTDTVDLSRVPAPIELSENRRPAQDPTASANRWLTRYIATPVRITGIVCETALDDSRADNWSRYNTIAINQTGDGKADSTNGCGGVNSGSYIPPTRFNVQFPGKGVGGFDPAVHAGQEVTITGMLQNSVSRSGKTLFWTVVVRDQTDVCLQPRAMCPNAQ